jgi:uncharacterized protein (TIGR01777 family)
VPNFLKRTRIAAPAEAVFAWHARPGAFERLAPPWEHVELLEQTGGIKDGARVVLRVGSPPVTMRWVAEHRDYIEGRQFRDAQVSGPFARWVHTHTVEPDGPEACWLQDSIDYALPGGFVGRAFGGSLTESKLERMFAYRHRTTIADVLSHQRFASAKRLRVVISGATGLVGSALAAFLTTGGHTVQRLTRRPQKTGDIGWDPSAGRLPNEELEGCDAIVHLAGENIAAGRWTSARKQLILESRVAGTRLLADTIARLSRPPQVFVSTSAIGFYGDRGDETLDESSTTGSNFLADVCRQWESATTAVRDLGNVRVAIVRLGVVLSPAGGALKQMLLPFRMGAGGVVGSGLQWMSWIALDDVIETIHSLLMRRELDGTFNAVAPENLTNAEFTHSLGRVLHRPTVFPMPAAAARLAFGEMADELLLASARVAPRRLIDAGFSWRMPQLDGALRHLLGGE